METVDGGFLAGENCLCSGSVRQPRMEEVVAEGHGTVGLYVDSEILDSRAASRARPSHSGGCGIDLVQQTRPLWIQNLNSWAESDPPARAGLQPSTPSAQTALRFARMPAIGWAIFYVAATLETSLCAGETYSTVQSSLRAGYNSSCCAGRSGASLWLAQIT